MVWILYFDMKQVGPLTADTLVHTVLTNDGRKVMKAKRPLVRMATAKKAGNQCWKHTINKMRVGSLSRRTTV